MVPGEDSLAHQDFGMFNRMIDHYRSAVFLHSHTHLPYTRLPRESRRGATRVFNAYERCILEL